MYTDGSWASRDDGASQGGYLIFAADAARIEAGAAMPLIVLEWASKKLPRVCRSSLAAEVQAAALGVDNFEWAKIFLTMLLRPGMLPDSEETARCLGESVLVTDCKGLYDASRSKSAGAGLAEKRSAIELMSVNDRLQHLQAQWFWTSARQQVADGLTKISSRTALAEICRRGTHSLVHDPEFAHAGKKWTKDMQGKMRDKLVEPKVEFVQEATEPSTNMPGQMLRQCQLSGCGRAVPLAIVVGFAPVSITTLLCPCCKL